MTPIAKGLFTDEPLPRLVGGRDRTTGRIVFPCPPSDRFEAYPLKRHGKIWSYTIQRFRPKSPPYIGPETFEPYPIAYVELADEVIVETRLNGVGLSDISIGMEVELTQIILNPEAETPLLVHAFQPKGADS